LLVAELVQYLLAVVEAAGDFSIQILILFMLVQGIP
jgi:hypothetical protein